MAVFFNNAGSDTFTGRAGEYNQVDYVGDLADYTFKANANGTVTVTHPQYGTDILDGIDGFWFDGEESWYSIEDAIASSNSGNTDGTMINGILTGTAGNDTLVGSNNNDLFFGGEGNDAINGNGGDYNQVEYDGALADYTFTQNANGSVTVTHPVWGTDTLRDIDGFWFDGEQSWYSMDQAIANSGNDGGNDNGSGGTMIDGILTGTAGNDTLVGSNNNDLFYGDQGNDAINGNGGNYNQVEYDGALADYTFTQNANGSVTATHPVWGTDTLTDIDGFWFAGEGAWYSIEEAIANTGDGGNDTGSGGTLVDGVLTGTNGDDALNGTNAADIFYAGMGNDVINGGGGQDVLNVDGDVIEWTINQRADGTVSMTHPTWGENIISSIEQISFGRSGLQFSLAEAIAQTAGLPEFRLDNDNVINGTNLSDVMVGTNEDENFYGGIGDDSYNGRGGFDQINYDGLRSEYTISDNGNGTLTVAHDVWGVDTVQNVEGLFFNGDNSFVAIDAAVG